MILSLDLTPKPEHGDRLVDAWYLERTGSKVRQTRVTMTCTSHLTSLNLNFSTSLTGLLLWALNEIMHVNQGLITGLCQPKTTLFLWRGVVEEKLREEITALAASMTSPESEQEPLVS